MEHLRELMRDADANYDGEISREEFDDVIEAKPEIVKILSSVGIEVQHLRDLFEFLDIDKVGAIKDEDFLGACLRIHAESNAQARDMFSCSLIMKRTTEKMEDLERSIEEGSERLNSTLFFVESRLKTQFYDLMEQASVDYQKSISSKGFTWIPKHHRNAKVKQPGGAIPQYPTAMIDR